MWRDERRARCEGDGGVKKGGGGEAGWIRIHKGLKAKRRAYGIQMSRSGNRTLLVNTALPTDKHSLICWQAGSPSLSIATATHVLPLPFTCFPPLKCHLDLLIYFSWSSTKPPVRRKINKISIYDDPTSFSKKIQNPEAKGTTTVGGKVFIIVFFSGSGWKANTELPLGYVVALDHRSYPGLIDTLISFWCCNFFFISHF